VNDLIEDGVSFCQMKHSKLWTIPRAVVSVLLWWSKQPFSVQFAAGVEAPSFSWRLSWCLGCTEAAHLSLQLRAAKENEDLTQVLLSLGPDCGMLHFTPFLLPQLPRWPCIPIQFSYLFCVLVHPSREFQYQSSKSEDYNTMFLFSLSRQVWKYCVYV